MKEETMSSLIDLCTVMESRESAVQDALELSWELYSKYTSEIHEIILDSVGMPRDNTVEMLKIHGKPEGFFQTDTFCRDIANGWFFKYTEGEITKEQLIHNVVNWKTIYDSYEE